MPDEPPKLIPLEAEPLGASIIDRLEWALEKARAGELSSIAIAVIYRDGSMAQRWSDLPSRPAMLGCVSHLAYRLNREADDIPPES